jgi:hypothetical protein
MCLTPFVHSFLSYTNFLTVPAVARLLHKDYKAYLNEHPKEKALYRERQIKKQGKDIRDGVKVKAQKKLKNRREKEAREDGEPSVPFPSRVIPSNSSHNWYIFWFLSADSNSRQSENDDDGDFQREGQEEDYQSE